jgi:ketosteroid isomerase-like protein
MQTIIETFIRAANAFDVDGALPLFAPDAVIEDVSVGSAFVGREGVRDYLERFFIGYHTKSRLLSLDGLDHLSATVRLDFTGDFGHEIGVLEIVVNAHGLIKRIDADLE